MKEGGIMQKLHAGVAYHAGRVQRDYIPALQEKFPTEKAPAFVEKTFTPEIAKIFLKSLITPEQQKRLHDLASSLADGQYRFREAAGTPEQGNRHVHDFIILKSASGIQFFFVDPEHAMGASKNHRLLKILRRGDIRPQVNVLYSMELTPENEVARVSALRYRASVIPEDKPQLNKPGEQFKMAESLLASGDLPEVIRGKENEISFQLDFRPAQYQHKVLVRARAARDSRAVGAMLEKLAAGQTLSSNEPLEGQLRRFRAIMRTYFPKYLEEGRFESLK